MAVPTSDTQVGNVTQAILKTTESTTGNTIETTIVSSTSKLRVSKTIPYSSINNTFRNIANLTRDSYADTILITRVSVSEVMAG